MAFIDFVRQNANRGDAIGDYCADTLRLIAMYPHIKAHLKYKKNFAAMFDLVPFHHVCPEARQAFLDAWKEYRGR